MKVINTYVVKDKWKDTCLMVELENGTFFIEKWSNGAWDNNYGSTYKGMQEIPKDIALNYLKTTSK